MPPTSRMMKKGGAFAGTVEDKSVLGSGDYIEHDCSLCLHVKIAQKSHSVEILSSLQVRPTSISYRGLTAYAHMFYVHTIGLSNTYLK